MRHAFWGLTAPSAKHAPPTLQKPSLTTVVHAAPLMQVDVWASTYATAKSVAEQVRLAMNGFSGTVSSVVIHGARAVNERDLYEEETRIHHIALEYEVLHAEAVA